MFLNRNGLSWFKFARSQESKQERSQFAREIMIRTDSQKPPCLGFHMQRNWIFSLVGGRILVKIALMFMHTCVKLIDIYLKMSK